MLTLPVALALVALGQDTGSQRSGVVAGGGVTNAPSTDVERVIGEINGGLVRVRQKLEAAGQQMKAAEVANRVDYAAAITNAASEIRKLAQTDLAENSSLATQANRLLNYMEALVAEGNQGMNNPGSPGADVYANGITAVRTALAKLNDKRASLDNVRKELLEKARALEGRAKAIDWLNRCQQADLATKAFCEAVDDVLAYAQRLGVIMNGLGGRGLPVT